MEQLVSLSKIITLVEDHCGVSLIGGEDMNIEIGVHQSALHRSFFRRKKVGYIIVIYTSYLQTKRTPYAIPNRISA